MLTSQKQNLAKKFIDGLTKYQTIQQQYQRAQQERVKRQYLIVNPNATQEELEAVADDQHAGPVFAQQLLSSQRYGAVRNQLDSVQQRHDEIVKLAQSIEQLHQLFMDMQTMIEAQDAYVMQVSNHINETAASTRKAADEMRVAVKHKKTSIKRKRLMILCCVILLLVIFSLLLFLPSSPLYIFTLIDKSKGTSSSNTSSNTNGNSNTSK